LLTSRKEGYFSNAMHWTFILLQNNRMQLFLSHVGKGLHKYYIDYIYKCQARHFHPKILFTNSLSNDTGMCVLYDRTIIEMEKQNVTNNKILWFCQQIEGYVFLLAECQQVGCWQWWGLFRHFNRWLQLKCRPGGRPGW